MPAERLNFIKTQQLAGQEAALRKVVPETFFRQATKIVESRKPTDPRLQDLDVLNMAKVLVVEDDSMWAVIHKNEAQEFGHEVVEASSAEEAKKAWLFRSAVSASMGADFWMALHESSSI